MIAEISSLIHDPCLPYDLLLLITVVALCHYAIEAPLAGSGNKKDLETKGIWKQKGSGIKKWQNNLLKILNAKANLNTNYFISGSYFTGCFMCTTCESWWLDDFCSSAECGVAMHVASWVNLPAASLTLPHLRPSLHSVLPPPHWELCNTLQGCQGRGMTGGLCVCAGGCVDGWTKKERLEYMWEYERERQGETYRHL